MSFSIIFKFLIVCLLINVTLMEFYPAIAFHKDGPIMYETKKDWVQYNESLKINNNNESIKICRIIYPTYNINNAAPLYKKVNISNWCKESKKNCTSRDIYEVQPIRCINATHNPGPLAVNISCSFHKENYKNCLSYEDSLNNATDFCRKNYKKLSDFKVIFTRSECGNMPMHFMDNEFVCCPYIDIPNTKLNIKDYINNKKYREHQFYSKIKHSLLKNYSTEVSLWQSEMCNNIIGYSNNKKGSSMEIDKDLIILKEKSKTSYIKIMTNYSTNLLIICKIHTERIINKTDKICKEKEKDLQTNDCKNHLKSTINQLRNYYKHTFQRDVNHIIGNRSFIKEMLQKLNQKYIHVFNQNNELKELYQKVINYLDIESSHSIMSYDEQYKKIFGDCNPYSKPSVDHHTHGIPVMSIVITTVILLILIVLTFLATLVIKYCGQPLRRSSPNYVMSVVFDTNPTPGVVQRPDHQIISIPNKQSAKLNLYENPIFNTKSSSKPIEKQSLIENMES